MSMPGAVLCSSGGDLLYLAGGGTLGNFRPIHWCWFWLDVQRNHQQSDGVPRQPQHRLPSELIAVPWTRCTWQWGAIEQLDNKAMLMVRLIFRNHQGGD